MFTDIYIFFSFAFRINQIITDVIFVK